MKYFVTEVVLHHISCQETNSQKIKLRTCSIDLIQREAGCKTVGVGLHALQRVAADCSGRH